jgi:hypothetical protein
MGPQVQANSQAASGLLQGVLDVDDEQDAGGMPEPKCAAGTGRDLCVFWGSATPCAFPPTGRGDS